MTQEEKWESKYNELVLYQKKNGSLEVSFTDRENLPLARWVGTQRQAYRLGTLKKERERKLREIGFKFISSAGLRIDREQWQEKLEELAAYKEKNGTINFPILPKGHEHHELSLWCNTQRIIFRAGRMTQAKKELLEGLGFAWDLDDCWEADISTKESINLAWLKSYEMCRDWVVEHGHDFSQLEQKDRRIYTWAKRQVYAIKRGEISKEKMDLLNMISFDSELFEIQQTLWYRELKKYTKYVNIVEAVTDEEKEAQLWLKKQLSKYRYGELSEKKIKILKSVGMDLEVTRSVSSRWLEAYNKFKSYSELKGGDLTRLADDDPSIYLWFMKQKKEFHQKELDSRKKKLLLEVNRDFYLIDKIDSRWANTYEEFKSKNVVTSADAFALRETEKHLYIWARRQVLAYKRNDLGILKARALDEINFDFNWFDEADEY